MRCAIVSVLCVLSLVSGVAACDGSGTGGDGGGGSGAGPVLGTKHDGDCDDAQDFLEACEAEGGIILDRCTNVGCTQPAYHATCFAPAPTPGPNEFSCLGAENCAVGELCVYRFANGDYCESHACEPPPSPCAADATCACLEAAGLLVIPATCTEGDGGASVRVPVQGTWPG